VKTYEEGVIEGARLAEKRHEELDETLRHLAELLWEERRMPFAVDNVLVFPTVELCRAAAPESCARTADFLTNFDKYLAIATAKEGKA